MRKLLRQIRGGYMWTIIGPFEETLATGKHMGKKADALEQARQAERRLLRFKGTCNIKFR